MIVIENTPVDVYFDSTIGRTIAGSVQINSTTLWILGGYFFQNYKTNTSEFVRLDSTVGIPGPPLPYGVKEFCAVKYSTDKIFVIGGRDKSLSFLNKVLIFNPNNFNYTEGPNLITPRAFHTCSLMSNGHQSKIVVAQNEEVEIFDPVLNNWIQGKEILS